MLFTCLPLQHHHQIHIFTIKSIVQISLLEPIVLCKTNAKTLRMIAGSQTEGQYEMNLERLFCNNVWLDKKKGKLRSWISNTWLPCYKVGFYLNLSLYFLFKGCVRYIFASLFFTSKRQHLWNKEDCFLFHLNFSDIPMSWRHCMKHETHFTE